MDFARDKGLSHAILFRTLYFIKKVTTKIFGKKIILKFLLDVTWLCQRLAFELGGEIFGNTFHNESLPTSPSSLKMIIPQGSRVIDIGCGSGRLTRAVSELGCEVVAIDHSSSNLEIARSKGGNIAYIEGDVNQNLADLGEFDFGLLIHLLEHIENPVFFLQKLRTSCKKLIIEVPDFQSDSLNWLRIKLKRPYYSDADHVREYSMDCLNQQLSESGWSASNTYQKGEHLLVVASPLHIKA